MVGREMGAGSFTYPSGTVTAVAALAVAAFLASPRLLRPLATIAGALAIAGVGWAVLVLRWHYPTDVLGGICVGGGAVFVIDSLAHLPWLLVVRPPDFGKRHGSPAAGPLLQAGPRTGTVPRKPAGSRPLRLRGSRPAEPPSWAEFPLTHCRRNTREQPASAEDPDRMRINAMSTGTTTGSRANVSQITRLAAVATGFPSANPDEDDRSELPPYRRLTVTRIQT